MSRLRFRIPSWSALHSFSLQVSLLTVVGLFLRLVRLTAIPLNNDEYRSLDEIARLGLNWNSILYFAAMRAWAPDGGSDAWLRLPSALLGALTVPVVACLGRKLAGDRAGLAAGLIACCSPFLLYHSQEVRFYALFILASSLFFLCVSETGTSPHSRTRALAAGAILALSHYLGVFAAAVWAAPRLLASPNRWARKLVWVGAALALACPLALMLSPALHRLVLATYAAHSNAAVPALAARSLPGPVALVKTAFCLFIFYFGYHVHPLNLWIVLPGVAVAVWLLWRGALALRRRGQLGPVGSAALALVFVVVFLDPLGGRLAHGVSPRHVAFLWPMLAVLLAAGLAELPRGAFAPALACVLAVQLAGTAARWSRSWCYQPANDFRAAAERVAREAPASFALVSEPLASPALDRYFPASGTRLELEDLTPGMSSPPSAPGLVVAVLDEKPEHRADLNRHLGSLETDFTPLDAWVDHGFFVWVLERRDGAPGFAVDARSGQVALLGRLYGRELRDLRLPVSVRLGQDGLRLVGVRSLPDDEGSRTLAVPLARPVPAERVLVVSSLLDGAGLDDGATVAELGVRSGTVETIVPLRLGEQTQRWDRVCASSRPCTTVLSWHKRADIVGQSHYPEAWRDFKAGVHAVSLALPARSDVSRLELRLTSPRGRLTIWALALLPPC